MPQKSPRITQIKILRYEFIRHELNLGSFSHKTDTLEIQSTAINDIQIKIHFLTN